MEHHRNNLYGYCIKNDLEAIQNLITHIDINEKNEEGLTILHRLCGTVIESYKPSIIKFLIDNGADVNIPDIFGDTPLHYAVYTDNYEVTQILLENGADVNIKNIEDHETALHCACENGNYKIVLLLLTYSADKNSKTLLFEKRPYDIAIERGWIDVAKLVK